MKSSKDTKKKSTQIAVSDSLALKYRPQIVDDMIGNATAKTAINGMLARKKFPNTLLLHGGTGMGKCVIGSTIISTARGLSTIESLVTHSKQGFGAYNGGAIRNIHGQLEQPDQGYKKRSRRLAHVKTYIGTEILGTPEHPVFCFKNGVAGFFKLCELEKGDYVGHAIPSTEKYEHVPDAYTLGMFLSAKSVYQAQGLHGQNSIILHWEDVSMPTTAFAGSTFLAANVRAVTYDGADEVLKTFKNLKVSNLLGSNDYCFSLLKGLFEPYVAQEESIRLKFRQEDIAETLQVMLFHFGVVSSVADGRLTIGSVDRLRNLVANVPVKTESTNVGSLPVNLIHEFEVKTGISLFTSTFSEAISKLRKRKVKDTQSIVFLELLREGMLFFPVSYQNEFVSDCMVYDLSMPKTHSFVANGIVNHNTTMARMISRYINCETGTACGECSSCRIGDASPDIHELNMATERGIDEIRTLISKSKLAPRFNKRIFILDELHQCFPAGTQVLMADGSEKAIETIQIGDSVACFNTETNKDEDGEVSAVQSIKNTKSMVKVLTNTGEITSTWDHKFWSAGRKLYSEAMLLRPEELLLTHNGERCQVQGTRMVSTVPTVYDITVPKNSNFFVKCGDVYVLVHNCTPQAKEALLKPLEEPPKNTMWILCTTDPQKLTKTILGRCQQIAVTAPEQKEMVKYLIKVAKAEGVKVTEERLPILKHIAQVSMGHSRNALQMLETFINLLAGDKNMSIEEISKMLANSTGEDTDETAAQLLACILGGKGQSAIKLLYQVGQNKDIMGMIFKLRWLIDFKLNSWAGTMKFNPTINQLFDKHYGKKPVNPVHLIQILATLVDCEVHIKTVSGLDERIYFSSKILNDMVKIVNESKD